MTHSPSSLANGGGPESEALVFASNHACEPSQEPVHPIGLAAHFATRRDLTEVVVHMQ